MSTEQFIQSLILCAILISLIYMIFYPWLAILIIPIGTLILIINLSSKKTQNSYISIYDTLKSGAYEVLISKRGPIIKEKLSLVDFKIPDYIWKDSDLRLDIISMKNVSTGEIHEYGNTYKRTNWHSSGKKIVRFKHNDVRYIKLEKNLYNKLKEELIIDSSRLDDLHQRIDLVDQRIFNEAYSYVMTHDSHAFGHGTDEKASDIALSMALLDNEVLDRLIDWLSKE